MNANALIQKLWNYCSVVCDEGMNCDDNVEQLNYLLFLTMVGVYSAVNGHGQT